MVLLRLEVDELLSALLEDGVHEALQAEGAQLAVGDAAAADGAGAVGRADDDVVAQRQQLVEDAVVEVLRPLPTLPGPAEVCASDVAHEEGVTGADKNRLTSRGEVRDGVGGASRGVAGGVDRRDLQLSDAELLPVPDLFPILELGPGAVVDLRTGHAGELEGADDVVLVPVGLEDVLDADSVPLGQVDVDPAVPHGVDDEGLVP